MGLFLGSLLCSIGLFVFFYASLYHSNSYNFVIFLETGNVIVQLFYSFLRLFWLFGVFCDSIQILRKIFFCFCEKYLWNFDGDCVEYVYHFGLFEHFNNINSPNNDHGVFFHLFEPSSIVQSVFYHFNCTSFHTIG